MHSNNDMHDPSQHEVVFSTDDLALIGKFAGASVGGGMILPSGLKTTDEVITLSGDFDENVRLMASIINMS